jgi:hypothetical protein
MPTGRLPNDHSATPSTRSLDRENTGGAGQMGTGHVNATSAAEGKVQVHGLTELGIGVKL